ncbi:MAG: SNF2-related protein [Phycisphaerae bacterium]
MATQIELLTRLRDSFSKNAREKGERYFVENRVQAVQKVSDTQRVAFVNGESEYDVIVEAVTHPLPHTMLAACTCPHFLQDGTLCKHIWAALRAFQKHDLLNWDGFLPVKVFADDDLLDELDATYPNEPMPDAPAVLSTWVSATPHLRVAAPTPAPPEPLQLTQWLSRVRLDDDREEKKSPQYGGGPIEPIYVLNLDSHEMTPRMMPISLFFRTRTATGQPGKARRLILSTAVLPKLATDLDRQIAERLLPLAVPARNAESEMYSYGYSYDPYTSVADPKVWRLRSDTWPILLPHMLATGRLCIRAGESETFEPAIVDEGAPWRFIVDMRPDLRTGRWTLTPTLQRGEEVVEPLRTDRFYRGDPLLWLRGRLLRRVEATGAVAWLKALTEHECPQISELRMHEVLVELSRQKTLPEIRWPERLGVSTVDGVAPTTQLTLALKRDADGTINSATAKLSFDYAGCIVSQDDRHAAWVIDRGQKRMIRRDPAHEKRCAGKLLGWGCTVAYGSEYNVPQKKMMQIIAAALNESWSVLGDKLPVRRLGGYSISFTSGVDWFGVNAQLDFDGVSVELPELLAAARKKEQFVKLGDGTMGVLPNEWLEKHGRWLELARVEDGEIRFGASQIGLIDALLAAMPDAKSDERIEAARAKLRAFDGIKAATPPKQLKATLRNYQAEGLAWLNFLDDFGFGGCLADDMGLGKTVQALAQLVARKSAKGKRLPSLVVAPRSLMFNWQREAARFAPTLKLLDYSGTDRHATRAEIDNHDLVLTTYGTLRRDIADIRQIPWDYVILDEAQAIKNHLSLSAKAARLLDARRRLALTGTPVENHIGELWSIFEFLNPGMLGRLEALKSAAGVGRADEASMGTLDLLRKSLRPFILRRTKERVAPELPRRTEQTIECELGREQRRLYDQLRDHYRALLLGKIEADGLNRSKIQILEALLRLRQAACHPGLIDDDKLGGESAKLESLLAMLTDAIDSGHKSLVFSQFTSMLDIVRKALDERGIVYEYLDGKTRDRQARVDRFQTDESCRVFLISLKAGGVGLNLTAADYVFILDPWWNPAVEAQAIDRAHRIGQDKSVIAYRLIARDTVEQRILDLQASKRQLADAIVSADESVIKSLTRDDLAALLS